MADQELIDAFKGVIDSQVAAFLDNLGEEMSADTIEDLKGRGEDMGAAMVERFRDALTINLESLAERAADGSCIHYGDRQDCTDCIAAQMAVELCDDSASGDDEDDEDGEDDEDEG